MLYQCPDWIERSFDDTTKLTIYVFETTIKKIKLYAIAHISNPGTETKPSDPHLVWYDEKGNYLGKSLNDSKII